LPSPFYKWRMQHRDVQSLTWAHTVGQLQTWESILHGSEALPQSATQRERAKKARRQGRGAMQVSWRSWQLNWVLTLEKENLTPKCSFSLAVWVIRLANKKQILNRQHGHVCVYALWDVTCSVCVYTNIIYIHCSL
jgi:urease accessory protein UreF